MKQSKAKRKRDYEVMEEVLNRGDAVELARRLGVSPQFVRAWCRQPEQESEFATGRTGPLGRLSALIGMIREEDGSPERGYPLATYIAGLLGGVFVPEITATHSANSDALHHMSTVLMECAKAVETTRVSWFDESPGEITTAESRQCAGVINEAISSLLQLGRWMDSQR